MGQFLAIGLITKQIIPKDQLEKGKISNEELISKMQKELHFNPVIFDFTENEKNIVFKLKKELFESELIPFLEKFYPLIYINNNLYLETLKELKNSKSENWLSLAEDKSCEEFQIDNYGIEDNLCFDKAFKPRVSVYYESILLSMEGKIMMESYGRQFNFLKLCMIEMFKEFRLAGALRVYITG